MIQLGGDRGKIGILAALKFMLYPLTPKYSLQNSAAIILLQCPRITVRMRI